MAISSTVTSIGRQWLSLPPGWDNVWKSARNLAASTAPAHVAVIGDSNALGYASSNMLTKSFAWLLRNNLVTKYGSYGDYYPVSYSARYATMTSSSVPTGTMPWTFDTTWGAGTLGGLQANTFGFGQTIGQDAGTFPQTWVNAGSGTFTTPSACTAFDIIWHDYNNAGVGTWKYSVDDAAGGGLVTVTNGGFNSIRRIPITGQTNATHTIRFGATTTSSNNGLNGVVTYDPTNNKTKGIGFAVVAAGFQKAFDWLISPYSSPSNRAAQWQGRSKTAAATEQLTGFGFPTQPHLAIIELGIVDCFTGVGLTQYRLGLRKLCDAIRRGRDNASIMFVIMPNGNQNTSDQTSPFARSEMWSLYCDHVYSIAQEYQCAVVNFHADWMSTPVAQGFTTTTDPHPTDLGHQTIANTLIQTIA